jgi:hypothetical protein
VQEEGTSLLRNSAASTARHLVLALIRADGAPLRSVLLERLRQVSGSEDICHPFEV